MNDLSLGRLGRAVNANADTTSETALGADGYGSTGTQVALSDFTFDDMGANTDVYASAVITHDGVSGSGALEPTLEDLLSDNGFLNAGGRRHIKVYNQDDPIVFSLNTEGAGSLFHSRIMTATNSNTFFSWDLVDEGSRVSIATNFNEISASYTQNKRTSPVHDSLQVRCYRISYDFDISTTFLTNIRKVYFHPTLGSFSSFITTTFPANTSDTHLQENLIGWCRLAAKDAPPGGGGGGPGAG